MPPPRLPRFLLATLRCVALAGAVLPGLPACSTMAAPASQPALASPALPLRLEHIPFDDPRATVLALDRDGRLRCYRFYPSRQVVAGSAERRLSPAERRLLERALAAPDLLRALGAGNLAGDGLVRGDQFRIALFDGKAPAREAWGFVDLAAPALRALIDTLLRSVDTRRRPAATPLAPSYLRARRVEPARAAELRRSTPLRIAALKDLSPGVRGLVEQAMRDPLLFHPLPPARRTELARLRSLGEDVFVSVGAAGLYQLRLYSVE